MDELGLIRSILLAAPEDGGDTHGLEALYAFEHGDGGLTGGVFHRGPYNEDLIHGGESRANAVLHTLPSRNLKSLWRRSDSTVAAMHW